MQTQRPILRQLALFLSWLPFIGTVHAEPLQVGQIAPGFQLQSQDGHQIRLADRQNQGWTVLYFYPKADTPGCTKQACAFRDSIKLIRDQNAEVYGVSTDEISSLQAFQQKYKLNFTLLSDPDATVTEAYGVKMPMVKYAKRWTFIIDPSLVIRKIDNDVDPALDAQRVADSLKQLQANP
jgi:peroxiredoxin Q/BCP